MGNFNRGGDRGGSRFGGNRGGFGNRPSFGNRGGGRGGDRGGDRQSFPKEMFKAVCTECSRPCEVPFRPTGGKPVLCRECFINSGGGMSRDNDRGDRFPKRDFSDRAPERPRFDNSTTSAPSNKGSEEMMKKIDVLTSKVDRLVQIVEKLTKTTDSTDITAVKDDSTIAKDIEEIVAPKKKAKKSKDKI